jgi:hypothetical protein
MANYRVKFTVEYEYIVEGNSEAEVEDKMELDFHQNKEIDYIDANVKFTYPSATLITEFD